PHRPATSASRPRSLHDALPIFSNMKHSYNTAAQTYARRYLYDGHILYYRDLKEEELAKDDGRYLKKVDINAMDPAIIQKFLGSGDRKSTRLNSSHVSIAYAVFC